MNIGAALGRAVGLLLSDIGMAGGLPPISANVTCRICGCQTRDWVVRYGNTGQCKCRACSR